MSADLVLTIAATVGFACVAGWSWRGGRRVTGFLFGLAGLLFGLVAVRHLPGGVVVALLLVLLSGAGAVTAWPLVTGRTRARRPRGGRRGTGRERVR